MCCSLFYIRNACFFLKKKFKIITPLNLNQVIKLDAKELWYFKFEASKLTKDYHEFVDAIF